MHEDPIIEEVRRIRQEYSDRFNYDLNEMMEDLRKLEQRHPDKLVSYHPKPARHQRRPA